MKAETFRFWKEFKKEVMICGSAEALCHIELEKLKCQMRIADSLEKIERELPNIEGAVKHEY